MLSRFRESRAREQEINREAKDLWWAAHATTDELRKCAGAPSDSPSGKRAAALRELRCRGEAP
jgi:hypothetical protein